MFDRLRRNRAFRNLAPAATVVLALLAGLAVDGYGQFVLSLMVSAIVIGAALTMLVGYARCITLATGAMMALGAYGSTLLVIKLGVPYLLAVLCAGIIGGIGGFLLAVPGVRFRGHNLAMVTLVFQAVVVILLREWRDVTGGAEGLNVPPPTAFGVTLTDDYAVLVLNVAVCALVLIPLAVLLNGAFGKNLRAVTGNEVGARAFGINVERHLIAAFTASSAFIAVAAALNAPRYRIIDPDSGAEAEAGELGMIVIHDLANTGSVAALATADLGRRTPDGEGFEVAGRDPDAEARGCSIAVDAMLADA